MFVQVSIYIFLTLHRDSADNAPARPDWSTPSYCANLQAPRDTWVQLRTASLVEPTHHVSVYFFHAEVFLPAPVSSSLSASPWPSPPRHSSFCSSVVSPNLSKLCRLPSAFPPPLQRSEAALNQSPMCASLLFSPDRSGVHHRMQLLKSYPSSRW